jgi:hypothetical protein
MRFFINTKLFLPRWDVVLFSDSVAAAQPNGKPKIDDLKTEICRRLNDARVSQRMYDASKLRLEIDGCDSEGGTYLHVFEVDANVL